MNRICEQLWRVALPSAFPDDLNEVDLILMLVPRTHGSSWPPDMMKSGTFSPYMYGYIVATIEAQDIAAGRPPRSFTEFQHELLMKWEEQSVYQNC